MGAGRSTVEKSPKERGDGKEKETAQGGVSTGTLESRVRMGMGRSER